MLRPTFINTQSSSPPQSMYFCLGHGASIKRQNTNNSNVILVKKVRCGHISRPAKAFSKAIDFFKLFSNPSNWEFFINDNYITSPKLNNFIENSHITRPSDQFVDGIYTPLTDFEMPDRTINLFNSGLFSNKTTNVFVKHSIKLKQINGENVISKDNINYIFKNSIYPTIQSIHTNIFKNNEMMPFINFKQQFMQKYEILISQLLQLCNHISNQSLSLLYYPVCRDMPDVSILDAERLSDETTQQSRETRSMRSNDIKGGVFIKKQNKKTIKRKNYKRRKT